MGYGIASYEDEIRLNNNSAVRNNNGSGIDAQYAQVELNDSAVSGNTTRGMPVASSTTKPTLRSATAPSKVTRRMGTAAASTPTATLRLR
jgi:hypothetical protein